MKKINDLRVIEGGLSNWERFCADMRQAASAVNQAVANTKIDLDVDSFDDFSFSVGQKGSRNSILSFSMSDKKWNKGFKFNFNGFQTRT